MSKSLGNVITPASLVEAFGLDPVRYFLLREVPYGNDGSFSHDAMVHRINGDLANDLGNLAQRVLSMIAKNCNGQLPEPGPFTPEDDVLLEGSLQALETMRETMGVQAFHRALEALWHLIAEANRYVDTQAPWALRKNDPARMGTVLFVLAEVIRRIALMTQPVMPESSAKMLAQLAVPEDERSFATITKKPALQPGTPLPKPQGVFPRIQVEEEGG
jgi:methionyl-tRNA synthetase